MVTRKVRYSAQRRWYQSPKASIPSTIATAPTSFRVLDCSEKARSISYLVKNAVIGRPAVARARLQVGDDAKHLVPQRVAVRGEDEHEDCDRAQHDEVQGSVGRDHPQDDLVA